MTEQLHMQLYILKDVKMLLSNVVFTCRIYIKYMFSENIYKSLLMTVSIPNRWKRHTTNIPAAVLNHS